MHNIRHVWCQRFSNCVVKATKYTNNAEIVAYKMITSFAFSMIGFAIFWQKDPHQASSP